MCTCVYTILLEQLARVDREYEERGKHVNKLLKERDKLAEENRQHKQQLAAAKAKVRDHSF